MLSIVSYLVEEAKLSIEQACDLIGVSRSSFYFWLSRGDDCDVDRRTLPNPNRNPPPWALPQKDIEQVKSILSRPEYADLSIEQIYYKELAKGRKYCSLRTMQRIAAKMRDNGEYQHKQKRYRKKPQC